MLNFFNKLSEFIEHLPRWLAYPIEIILFTIVFFIVPIMLVWLMSALFWQFPWFFVFLLVLIPALTWFLSNVYKKKPIPITRAKSLRKFLMICYIIVAIVVGLNFTPLRDMLAHKFIPKYEVEYREDYDSYGNTSYFPDINTSHWYFTIIAHAIIPFFYILLISLLIFQYSKASIIVEKSETV